MKEAASQELLRVSNDSWGYKRLLKDLIVQNLLRLKEPLILLWCREVVRRFVESILNEAKQEDADKARVHPPNINVDLVYLPPPPTSSEAHGTFCSGGVVLASQDGKIVCENTLDARLEVAFRQKLPEIRKRLFGKMEA